MAEESSIEWTDATWNPWRGCKKVSPGCQRCYMFRILAARGENPEVVIRSKTTFNDPLKWPGRKMVFTCSLSDFFHPAADGWRDDAWDVIRRTPLKTYQILTKRPERIAAHLPRRCYHCGLSDLVHGVRCPPHDLNDEEKKPLFWPWPNVWLGTSVELQQYLGPRTLALTSVPAIVHFLSCEPLLGRLDFTLAPRYENETWLRDHGYLRHIEWVIDGGESDYDEPRFSDPDWFRGIRDQCERAGVPYFHKQNGGRNRCRCHDSWGCRLLDGRTYDAMPDLTKL